MRGRAILVLAVLALVVGSALAVFYLALPPLVARAVESIGSDVTDTAVEVGSARLRLRKTTATLWGLRVANPPGFGKRPAMEVRSLALAPVLRALLQGRSVIDRLDVGASVVRVEIRAGEGVNVLELRKRIDASARAGERGSRPAEPGDVVAAKIARTRIHVNTLSIAPVRVLIEASAIGVDDAIDLTLPSATLRNVEGTPAQLTRTVMRSILDRTVSVAAEKAELDPDEGFGAALRRGARKLLDVLPGR
jgi:hypothetical protein